MNKRGFCGLVMYHPKDIHNWGSLMRTANILNVNFIATIGQRFPKQSSDTLKTWRHVPIFQFDDLNDFYCHLPYDCRLIGIELCDEATDLSRFVHPERACYILGAEDYGLPKDVLNKCNHIVKLKGKYSMNVSIAGSIVLYDRINR